MKEKALREAAEEAERWLKQLSKDISSLGVFDGKLEQIEKLSAELVPGIVDVADRHEHRCRVDFTECYARNINASTRKLRANVAKLKEHVEEEKRTWKTRPVTLPPFVKIST